MEKFNRINDEANLKQPSKQRKSISNI